jgi:hypothetical protein
MNHDMNVLFVWILMVIVSVWWWFTGKSAIVKHNVLLLGISVLLTGLIYLLFKVFDTVVLAILGLFGLFAIVYYLIKAITTK